MIFWTWRSYFICWQIFENKVWCPVSKKRRRYFHFLLSLAYPIDRLDWALFSVVILFHHLFPLLEKVEIQAFILPRNFPAVLIIITGRGGAGRGTPPSPQGGASIPAVETPYPNPNPFQSRMRQWKKGAGKEEPLVRMEAGRSRSSWWPANKLLTKQATSTPRSPSTT